MEEILHQLIGSLSHYIRGITSQVVQEQKLDFKAPCNDKTGLVGGFQPI